MNHWYNVSLQWFLVAYYPLFILILALLKTYLESIQVELL